MTTDDVPVPSPGPGASGAAIEDTGPAASVNGGRSGERRWPPRYWRDRWVAH